MIHLIDRDFIKNYRYEILLAGILILSAFLNMWNIWNQGITNTYYAAAVKTMLVNPWAGFFNSIDPAGFITIDKPPVGLWVQAVFAAVLGFSGWVLVLPQALAGVGSVALIYLIISRPFGKPAGLVAALALAATPILVAVSRNGTMDTQMIFVLLLAVWVVLKATRERSLPWFLVAAALVGLAFNIKMIQAYIAVPAILAVYFLGTTDFSWKKRFLHVGLAIVVLLAVSFSWAVAVDAIPADQRPYIGGSGDNTVLGLIINYNGLHRLGIGESGSGPGSGGGFSGQAPGSMMATTGQGNSYSSMGPGGSSSFAGSYGEPPTGTMDASGQYGTSQYSGPSGMQQPGSSGSSDQSGRSGMGGGGGMNSGGSPGIFRIFNNGLAGDIAWLLSFALIGLFAWLRIPKSPSLKGIGDAGYFSEKGLTLIAMLLWLIPGLLYFSFTSGFWHDYYIATIAPPIAGLVGIGAVGMYRKYQTDEPSSWLLVLAVLITGLIEAFILSYDADWAGILIPIVLFVTLAGAGLLAIMKILDARTLDTHRKYIAIAAIAVLFIAPLIWSCTPIMTGNGGNIPSTGPQGSRGGMGSAMAGPGTLSTIGGPGSSGLSGMDYQTLGAYSGDRFSGSRNSTGYMDRTGMTRSGTAAGMYSSGAAGGFPGSQAIDLATFQEYIRDGKVRYVQTGGNGGGGMGGGNSEIFSWVSSTCTPVNIAGGNSTTTSGASLYDCAGAVSSA